MSFRPDPQAFLPGFQAVSGTSGTTRFPSGRRFPAQANLTPRHGGTLGDFKNPRGLWAGCFLAGAVFSSASLVPPVPCPVRSVSYAFTARPAVNHGLYPPMTDPMFRGCSAFSGVVEGRAVSTYDGCCRARAVLPYGTVQARPAAGIYRFAVQRPSSFFLYFVFG